jgi:hypothetical protein
VDDVRFIGTPCTDGGGGDAGISISATKVCVGGGFDATFVLSVAGVTEAVPCGGAVTASDVEPGAHAVSETVSGDDADAITTVIVCNGVLTAGPSTTVTIPEQGAVDVACVVINVFDPDGDEDVLDLICNCPIDVEIDIDTSNTNTLGVDNGNTNGNANENPNTNTNGNDLENTNDIDNTNNLDQNANQELQNNNEQNSNNTSSPEVHLEFN